jgi:hypothetical protein
MRQREEDMFYKECSVLSTNRSVIQEDYSFYNTDTRYPEPVPTELTIPHIYSPDGEITTENIVRKARYKPLIVWDKPIGFETKLTGKGSYFEFEIANAGLPLIVALSSEAIGDIVSSYRYPKTGGRIQYQYDTYHQPIENAVGGIGAFLDAFDYLDDVTETDCDAPDTSWTSTLDYPFRWDRVTDSQRYWYIPDPRTNNAWVDSGQALMGVGRKYRIWISDEGNIEYWVNYDGTTWSQLPGGQTVPYDAPGNEHSPQPPYTVWLYTNYPGAGLKNMVWSNNFDSEVGSVDSFTRTTEETEIQVTESEGDESSAYDIQKFNTTDIYQICDSSYVVAEEFKVKRKDAVNQKVYANKELVTNDDDIAEIWKINRLRMTTTKKVTDLNINVAMILYARYKPESDANTRGGKK